MATVLFIDDDPRILQFYISAVEALPGIASQHIETVDDALAYLRDPKNPADIIVWDMMMPAGDIFAKKDTEGGLSTGRLLLPVMKELRPDASYILLTLNDDVLQEFEHPQDRQYARSKLHTPPEFLAALIREILGGQR